MENSATRSATGLGLLPRYLISAVISVGANLLAQEAVVQAVPPAPLMLSIIFGTGVGFLVKYVIDKTWTFRARYTDYATEARRMSLSAVFSVLTTIIFWTFEVLFFAIWGTAFAKYSGAVLGLAIGYFVKFLLDRKHVFKESAY